MSVKIKIILNVLFKKNLDIRVRLPFDEKKNFNPTHHNMNTTQIEMPNAVAVWCDPFWTGMYVKATHVVKDDQDVNYSVFYIEGSINFKGLTSLQNNLCEKGEFLSLCDSIKCHFFYEKEHSKVEGVNEIKRDFLYSSGFPLIFERNRLDKQANVFGVFNYNANETSCEMLPDIRIVVHYDCTACIQPEKIVLAKLKGPSKNTHDRVNKLTHWFDKVIGLFCEKNKSNFRNFRTYCRDFGNALMFPHLPLLFDYALGPSLPMEITFYCMYNALRINNVSTQHVLNELLNLNTEENISIFLRIFRDSIVPWCMCVDEGLYTADKSLGQDVEDQPFPLSFLPGRRIFNQDDCEGRISEAQQLKRMYISIYQFIQHPNNISSLANAMSQRGSENTLLNISLNEWTNLVHICYSIGKLLESKQLEFHTIVGDVHFKKFEETHAKEESLSGHSFGLLLYQENTSTCTYAYVVEATGWERKILKTDVPPSKMIMEIISEIAKTFESNQDKRNIIICGEMSDKAENDMYKNICLGNDCIFFSIRSEKGENQTKLDYGVSLEQLKDKKLNRLDENENYIDTQSTCIQISFGRFLHELQILYRAFCGDRRALSTSVFLSNGWVPTKIQNESKKREWMKILSHVDSMISEFNEYKDDIRNIKRCVGTPQKKEEEFLDIFRSTWKTIEEFEIYSENEGKCSGNFISILNKNEFIKILNSKPKIKIQEYAFIKSNVLNLKILE